MKVIDDPQKLATIGFVLCVIALILSIASMICE